MTEQAPKKTEPSNSKKMYVVGIGASAGGLEAITELVRNLPEKISAAYVIAQHMSPDHRSLLATLISRATSLSVKEIKSGVEIKENIIYVTPPNKDVLCKGNKLILREPSNEPAAPKPSVDRFLISLAEEMGEHSMGIILSGTGSDGSYGVQSIRAAGGITISQDDKSAKYDGMPASAVETGCIDLILSPKLIGRHLVRILSSPRDLEQFKSESETQHPLSDLLQIVLAKKKVDFRDYKQTTIQRRLERRMTALGIQKQTDYTKYCRTNPKEVDALYKDLLISVTSFFRDPDEFESLRKIVKNIVQNKKEGTLRVWIGACATGEEAYSVAMVFADEMGGLNSINKEKLQIFATDIDANALNTARTGRYSLAALDDIPDELSDKYIVKDNQFIVIKRQLKNIILFSNHNICQDPPFTHLDLVCCRNLLIYFNSSLQVKVLSRLHYAMNGEGYLFLGTAETTTISDDLFRAVAGTSHIFRKRIGSRANERHLLGGSHPRPALRNNAGENRHEKDSPHRQFEQTMFDQLAECIGKNSILISDDFRILRIYGDISKYVSLTKESKLQMSLSMLKSRIYEEARIISSMALRRYKRKKGNEIKLSRRSKDVIQLEAFPIKLPDSDEGLVLLSIHSWRESAPRGDKDNVESHDNDETAQIENLNAQLQAAREELQQTVEELETSNEELQSSNEELQSSNEELQATNEELETSNEELQSTNEELVTVNEELHISKAELEILNDEQDAILKSVSAPMVIVDPALQITNANDSAIDLFGLKKPVDLPHVSQCGTPDGFPNLAEICNDSIQLGKEHTVDFISKEKAYTLKCSPFFNVEKQIRGTTLVFVESPAASRLAMHLENVLESAPIYYVHKTREGKIISVSEKGAIKAFGVPAHSVIGKNISEFLDQETLADVRRGDIEFLDGPDDAQTDKFWRRRKDQSAPELMNVQRFRVKEGDGVPDSIFLVAADETHIGQQEMQIIDAQRELLSIYSNTSILMMQRDRNGVVTDISSAAARRYGYSRQEALGKSIFEFIDEKSAKKIVEIDNKFMDGGEEHISGIYKITDKTGNESYLNMIRHRLDSVDNSVWSLGIEVGKMEYDKFRQDEEFM